MKTSLSVLSTALIAVLSVSALSVRADNNAPVAKNQLVLQKTSSTSAEALVVRAQGHPNHVDFVARSSKRADLRANISRRGLDVAFTEWLRAEHPHVYRQHLEQTARENQKFSEKKVAER